METIKCPKCNVVHFTGLEESPGWSCENCHHGWDTFLTKGKCPKCSHIHERTTCLCCHESSSHIDFYWWDGSNSSKLMNKIDLFLLMSILIRLPIFILSLFLFTIFYSIKSVLEIIIMFIVFPIMVIFFNKKEIRSFSFYEDFLQDLREFCSKDNIKEMIQWILSSDNARLVHVYSTYTPVYHFILNIISWFITVIVFSVCFSYLLSHLFPFQI